MKRTPLILAAHLAGLGDGGGGVVGIAWESVDALLVKLDYKVWGQYDIT